VSCGWTVLYTSFSSPLLQQRPSCSDDDQTSADLHRWRRNPKRRARKSAKYDPISKKKLFMAMRHDNAFRASGAYPWLCQNQS
jgi:hypothetical protein